MIAYLVFEKSWDGTYRVDDVALYLQLCFIL